LNFIAVTLRSTNLGTSTNWLENGVTVVGDIGRGEGLNQLSSPLGIYIDDNQTIYIADHWNHRIVACRSEALYSQVVAGGNGEGNRTDQLNGPTDIVIDKAKHFLIISDKGNRRVLRWPFQKDAHGEKIISDIDCYGIAMDDSGCLYISDTEKHEVRRFSRGEKRGTRVAGGNGQGNRLDQLDYPTYLFVDHEYSVYVSDMNNHRVMKWMKDANKGIVVAGGQGEGNGPGQLPNPCGLAVDRLDNVYVVDGNNHRVMRWSKGATQGDTVAGEYGKGTEAYQLNGPTGLSFDQQGNLYVVDWGNNRVQRFDIDTSSNF
jgi:sugar lactone lactonase YvrE